MKDNALERARRDLDELAEKTKKRRAILREQIATLEAFEKAGIPIPTWFHCHAPSIKGDAASVKYELQPNYVSSLDGRTHAEIREIGKGFDALRILEATAATDGSFTSILPREFYLSEKQTKYERDKGTYRLWFESERSIGCGEQIGLHFFSRVEPIGIIEFELDLPAYRFGHRTERVKFGGHTPVGFDKNTGGACWVYSEAFLETLNNSQIANPWRYAGGSEKDAGRAILGLEPLGCEDDIKVSEIVAFAFPEGE